MNIYFVIQKSYLKHIHCLKPSFPFRMVQTQGGPSGVTPENNDETTRLATIIAKQMANVLPTIINQLNHNQGGANNFTFKQFMDAKPLKFSGADGATVLLQWLESIENTLDYVNCPENLMVKMATSVFHKGALTWWNTQKATRGRDAALALPWDEFKTIMVAKFCPKHEIRKLEIEMWDLAQDSGNNEAYTARFHELCILVPHLVTPMTRRIDRYIGGLPLQIRGNVMGSNPTTLEATIQLSASLTEEYVKAGILTRKGNKKKAHEEAEKPRTSHKKQKISKQYVEVIDATPINQFRPAQNSVRKPYTRTHPLCNRCRYHHPANANCRKYKHCGKIGHTENFCRTKNPTNTNIRACFGCGEMGHLRNQCPNVKNNGTQALALVLATNETREEPSNVTGTILINNQDTYV